MRTRGGWARAFCCVTSRRPASPPLARTHARSFSVLAPLFLHFPFLPDRRSRSARAVHSGNPGLARRRRRRLREKRKEAAIGERTPESPPERSRLPTSCRRRGPPTRSPVPLPRSRCECDTPPREGRPGGRPRPRGGVPGSHPFPSPAFGSLGFFPLGSIRSCLGVGGPVSLFRLPLAGGGHFSSRCPLPPSLNLPFASPCRKPHFPPSAVRAAPNSS